MESSPEHDAPNPKAAGRIRIRAAAPGDVPLILRFIRELAEYERDAAAVVATEASLTLHLFGEGLSPHCPAGPRAECVIGELDGVAQGFAVYFHNFSTWTGRPGLYLEDLYVTPQARGVGLGKALLVHVAEVARERGCPRMEWAVLDWNTPAIEFYRRLGAAPLHEWSIFRITGPALQRLAEMHEQHR